MDYSFWERCKTQTLFQGVSGETHTQKGKTKTRTPKEIETSDIGDIEHSLAASCVNIKPHSQGPLTSVPVTQDISCPATNRRYTRMLRHRGKNAAETKQASEPDSDMAEILVTRLGIESNYDQHAEVSWWKKRTMYRNWRVLYTKEKNSNNQKNAKNKNKRNKCL